MVPVMTLVSGIAESGCRKSVRFFSVCKALTTHLHRPPPIHASLACFHHCPTTAATQTHTCARLCAGDTEECGIKPGCPRLNKGELHSCLNCFPTSHTEEKATGSGSGDSLIVGTAPQTRTGHSTAPIWRRRRGATRSANTFETAGFDGRAPCRQ